MNSALTKRLDALEQIGTPGPYLLPSIIHWPEHGTPEEQAATQREIDAHEAAGQMVFVIRQAGDYETMIDHFI